MMPWVAILTSPGRGAVASLAVWGKRAGGTVNALFSPATGGGLVDVPLGRVLFGRWRVSGEEVVICRLRDDEIEIHCHGGQAAVQAVLASLTERGCQPVAWRHWPGRQVHRPFAADALEALAQAATLRCAGILLDQLHGSLDAELAKCIAMIESNKIDRHEAAPRLRQLAERYPLGSHLTAPFHVVFAGQPNVGKSSLINALAGYERSIVFDQPGTTRDVITLRTAIGGWSVELSDTAGLRTGGGPLESAGVQLARERMNAAHLVLLVFDASRSWQEDDEQLVAESPNAEVLHNKGDVAQPPPQARPGLVVSARTGQGLDQLLDLIASRLVPDPPPRGAAVPFAASHHRAICEAIRSLDEGDRTAAARRLKALLAGR